MSSHTCKTVVVGCMDFRLHSALHKWAFVQYGKYDLVHLAGGARSVIEPITQDVVLKQIETSARLHDSDTVVLVVHMDCGAYGGSAAFDHDEVKERTTYEADLRAAAELITSRFPKHQVVKAIQALDGTVTVVS